jgi:hypothetical protein
MSDPPNRPRDSNGRDQRLRQALRDNLKRRKAQARGRADQATKEQDGDASPSVESARRDGGDDLN